MKVALIQLCAGNDKDENLDKAVSFIKKAAGKKARFVLLPEVFTYRGQLTAQNQNIVAETIPGETTKIFGDLAKLYNIFILAGSIYEKSNQRKLYNSSVLINPKGQPVVKYQKINLFNARIGKTNICESDSFLEGQRPSLARVDDFKVGLSVCFDLRFPEIYRTYFYQGAQILTVPSAFTKKTGEAHWEVLLRARAIETQAFVLAPNQVGKNHRGVESYGNSMVIDPWGKILARGSKDKEEIVFADISLKSIHDVQKILPLNRNRRTYDKCC
jgi:predicted amidohydrolase